MNKSDCLPELFAEEKMGIYKIFKNKSYKIINCYVNFIEPEPLLSIETIIPLKKSDKSIRTTLVRTHANKIYTKCSWVKKPELILVKESGIEISVINMLSYPNK